MSELSSDTSKWATIIELTGGSCLKSSASVKSVKHVLSTATIRGPQQTLFTATLPYMANMLKNTMGIEIITSLIKYGTSKTVEGVAKSLLEADPELWTFKNLTNSELSTVLSQLLDALVYREDCRGKHRQKIIENLKCCSAQHLFTSILTLPALGRLFNIDSSFAKSITGDKHSRLALCQAAATKETKMAALQCCKGILCINNPDVGRNDSVILGSQFIFDALKESFSNGVTRPREEFIALMAEYAPPQILREMAKLMSQWTNIRELAEKDLYNSIISFLIERTDDERICSDLVESIIHKIEDVDKRLRSRKAVSLRLLSAIARLPYVVSNLEKKLKINLRAKLNAAKVSFDAATMPKATVTRNNIQEKLKLIQYKTRSKRTRE